MPDQRNIIKDSTFYYFSQSGDGSEFQKRRLALTNEDLCIAFEDGNRMLDRIPLHEVLNVSIGPPEIAEKIAQATLRRSRTVRASQGKDDGDQEAEKKLQKSMSRRKAASENIEFHVIVDPDGSDLSQPSSHLSTYVYSHIRKHASTRTGYNCGRTFHFRSVSGSTREVSRVSLSLPSHAVDERHGGHCPTHRQFAGGQLTCAHARDAGD